MSSPAGVVPHLGGQHPVGQNASGVPGEARQQVELLGGQGHRVAGHRHRAAHQIDRQVSAVDHGGLQGAALRLAQRSAHPTDNSGMENGFDT
ncbi:MAG: hypothetical protein U0Y82_15610 [Thermoleophilia bacterium]